MELTRKHWLLALLAGVLLGLLGVLLLMRSEPRPQAQPEAPGSPAATPIPVTETAPPEPTPSPLPTPDPAGEALRAFASQQPGRWSLAWQRLPAGEPILVATDEEPMVSASLIKLYIMGAVYEGLESGALEQEEVYPLLFAMITYSDNASANSLIRLLGDGDETAGMAAVNDWCAREGYTQTRLNRLMLRENGLQNYTTAGDCAALLASIYRGDCVSEAASREMLSLLLQQTVNDRLPLGLPEGTPIAHKTGDLAGLCWADAGIVYSPGGDYILCVISDGTPSEREAKDAMGALSAQLYGIVNPEIEP